MDQSTNRCRDPTATFFFEKAFRSIQLFEAILPSPITFESANLFPYFPLVYQRILLIHVSNNADIIWKRSFWLFRLHIVQAGGTCYLSGLYTLLQAKISVQHAHCLGAEHQNKPCATETSQPAFPGWSTTTRLPCKFQRRYLIKRPIVEPPRKSSWWKAKQIV